MDRNKIKYQKSKIVGLVIISLFTLYLFGCSSSSGGEKFGDIPDEKAAKTAIGTILLNPNDYVDKEVVIEGTITSECPAGGWINVKDSTGSTIYVEMHGTSFAPIPQKVGSTTLVKGIVFLSGGERKETKLLGKGLIIK